MSVTTETFGRPEGYVQASFLNVATGQREEIPGRHNTLSYLSAEVMAAAFGGDASYIPSRIGFIYGGIAKPALSSITRDQTWSGIQTELGDIQGSANADMQVVSFSSTPTLGLGKSSSSSSSSSSDSRYNNLKSTGSNAVTFHAHSNSTDKGVFGTSTNIFSKGSYVYEVALLGYLNSTYYVIARSSLAENGDYFQKPNDFELSIDWTIKFF